MIDKIDGLNPHYTTRKAKENLSKQAPNAPQDSISISREASQAAEAKRVSELAKASQDSPERIEKIRQIQERLANKGYDTLSAEELHGTASAVLRAFTQKNRVL